MKKAYIASMRMTPVVMRNDPMLMAVPVQSRSSGMSLLWIVCPPEYSRVKATKMFNVPSVTMNGGRRRRVTSRPFRPPAAVPTVNPRPRATGPGSPSSRRWRP